MIRATKAIPNDSKNPKAGKLKVGANKDQPHMNISADTGVSTRDITTANNVTQNLLI